MSPATRQQFLATLKRLADPGAKASVARYFHADANAESGGNRILGVDNWDLVDRAAPHVVGGYLADKPRQVLLDLARSRNPWKRRTAIVSTWYFIRRGDVDDTFGIAEVLVDDEHELVQKAVGSWLREAGKRDQRRLLRFLDDHGATMPRTILRSAVERLPPKLRAKYASSSSPHHTKRLRSASPRARDLLR